MTLYISSRGSIIVISNRSDNELAAEQFSHDPVSGKISKTAEFSWVCKLKVECLSTNECLETLTGRRIPCLLVSCRNNNSCATNNTKICYIIFIDESEQKFIPLRKFKYPNWAKGSKAKQLDQPCSGSADDSIYSDSQQHHQIFLLDGPAVAILQGKDIYLFCEEAPDNRTLTEHSMTFKLPEICEQACCDQVKRRVAKADEIIGVKCEDGMCMVFVKLRMKQKCPVHRKQKLKGECRQELVVVKFSRGRFDSIEIRDFIPWEYHPVAQCILVHHVNLDVDSKHANVTYVGTSDGFVLQLENGVLKRCTSLSTDGPVSRLLSAPGVDRQHVLVIQDAAVTVMDRDLKVEDKYTGIKHIFRSDFLMNGSNQFLLFKDTFSESAQWYIHDLEQSSVQGHQTPGPCDGSQRSKDGESVLQDYENNTHAAVIALQARLQGEKVALHTKEKQMKQQKAFLQEMFSQHLSLSAGIDHVADTHKVDLVPLVSSTGVPDHLSGHPEKSVSITTDVQVLEVWQRTYRDRWCVAVEVVNKSGRDILAWLDIVPDGDAGLTSVISSVSKPVDLLSSSPSAAAAAAASSQMPTSSSPMVQLLLDTNPGDRSGRKKAKIVDANSEILSIFPDSTPTSQSSQDSRLPGTIHEKQTVSAVSPLPSFSTRRSYCIHVMLKWRQISSKQTVLQNTTYVASGKCKTVGTSQSSTQKTDFKTSLSLPVSNDGDTSRIYTLNCGLLALTSKEVVQGVYEIKFERGQPDQREHGSGNCSTGVTMHDLKDGQRDIQAWQILQSVIQLSVRSTAGILAKFSRMVEERCGFRYNSSFKCFTTDIPALCFVQLKMKELTGADSRRLDVYYRNEEDVILLIHHLYSCLPDHVVIVPVTPASLWNCLPSMHQEVHFLSHGLRMLLNDHESNKSVNEEDGGEDDDIRKVGEKFKIRRQKVMQRQKHDAVSGDLLDVFTKQMNNLHIETDYSVVINGC